MQGNQNLAAQFVVPAQIVYIWAPLVLLPPFKNLDWSKSMNRNFKIYSGKVYQSQGRIMFGKRNGEYLDNLIYFQVCMFQG